MRQSRTYGSVGARGEQSPRATRPFQKTERAGSAAQKFNDKKRLRQLRAHLSPSERQTLSAERTRFAAFVARGLGFVGSSPG